MELTAMSDFTARRSKNSQTPSTTRTSASEFDSETTSKFGDGEYIPLDWPPQPKTLNRSTVRVFFENLFYLVFPIAFLSVAIIAKRMEGEAVNDYPFGKTVIALTKYVYEC